MRVRRFWVPSGILAFLLVATTAVGFASTADAARTSAADPINWVPCYEFVTVETNVPYECADIEVPLDYDKPHKDTITIAATRVVATDQENKIGTILLNPGGPGGSGVDMMLGIAPALPILYGPEVTSRFDFIGFDPRGIQRSTPIRCFSTFDEAVSIFPEAVWPDTKEERAIDRQAWRRLANACKHHGDAAELGSHMSTANVARDMDLIRERLGEEQLNYIGFSYGSYLGATYVNLFPDRVRSFIVDAVLDPEKWVNKDAKAPFSALLGSHIGAQDTLNRYLELCEAAGPERCDFAPNSTDRFEQLYQTLAENPVELEPGFFIDEKFLVAMTLGPLYSPFAFQDLASFHAFLEFAISGAAPPAPMMDGAEETLQRFYKRNETAQEPYPNFVEGFPAVGCVDTNNPNNSRAWRDAAEANLEESIFGGLWTYASAPCQTWKLKDRDAFEGPFNAVTANPVLIANTLQDPATPYPGAVRLRELLPNSALLTVDAPGHGTLGLSACADQIAAAYLLDPSTAHDIDGTVCPMTIDPFPELPPMFGPPPDEMEAEAEQVVAEAKEVLAVEAQTTLVATTSP